MLLLFHEIMSIPLPPTFLRVILIHHLLQITLKKTPDTFTALLSYVSTILKRYISALLIIPQIFALSHRSPAPTRNLADSAPSFASSLWHPPNSTPNPYISNDQDLKKLCLKSLKRALDLFSPIHGHYTPSDPASKQIRISYKLNAEYGSVKNLSSSNQGQGQVGNDGKTQGDKASTFSALTLPGKDDIRDLQKGASENAIISGPTMPSKTLESGIPRRCITGAVVSISGSSER